MRLNDKTKTEKDKIRQFLRERDGNGTRAGTWCFVDRCMNEEQYHNETGKDFDICHLDDNPNNWNWQNLFLGTHPCNVRLTPRGKGKFNAERITDTQNSLRINKKRSVTGINICIEESGLRVSSLSEFKNHTKMPIAIRVFKEVVQEKKEVEIESLLDAMANASGLRQNTCRGYVKALINEHNGEYEDFEVPIEGTDRVKTYIRKRIP
jgi:hypothetical protein